MASETRGLGYRATSVSCKTRDHAGELGHSFWFSALSPYVTLSAGLGGSLNPRPFGSPRGRRAPMCQGPLYGCFDQIVINRFPNTG